jgi:AraC family transcriptional regulator of adaptative response / DNA-3-methyladenine glycosylase II
MNIAQDNTQDNAQDSTAPGSSLDPQLCRQARLSRDPRFDGEFFLAVHTTGIYCRPICPARAPAEKNVAYYSSAALAAHAGFRPCLRCRPESAPDSPAWKGSSTTVGRALDLIQQGVLNEGTLQDLAQRLGIGERYLRKLFQRELGVSPQALALNQRLLFAKKLLAETDLPITDVAFAAGFGSVRRFNSAVRTQFRLTPRELRRRPGERPNQAVTLQLQYRPPYDWEGVIRFFQRHAIAGVESVTAQSYQRNISLAGTAASFQVRPLPGKNALELAVDLPDHSQLMPLVARARRMFDLDANPMVISQSLGCDPLLRPLVQAFPGIRAPGSWSLYESAIRSIVGQQVSTAAARSICARLAATSGDNQQHPVFPDAALIASLDDQHFPMPGRRRDTLRTLCASLREREHLLDLEALAGFKGVGPWTVAMVNMRGAGNPDVLPAKDLGLEHAWRAIAGEHLKLSDQSAQWRPWRSYAANLLWRSLGV